MPAKIKAVPIRMPEALRAKVKAYAEARTLSEHKALLELVNKGLRAPDMGKPASAVKPDPKSVLAQAEAGAAHLAAPKPKAGSRWNLSSVQLGPTPSIPGSRLKTARK
jgi:hypothetical protein